MNAAKVLEDLKRRFPNEPEYHQAVEEVLALFQFAATFHQRAGFLLRKCCKSMRNHFLPIDLQIGRAHV